MHHHLNEFLLPISEKANASLESDTCCDAENDVLETVKSWALTKEKGKCDGLRSEASHLRGP